MHLFASPSVFSCLLALTQHSSFARAAAVPADEKSSNLKNNVIGKRCSNPCGFYSQVCCGPNEVCFTDASDQARCGVAQNNGQGDPAPAASAANQGNWEYYTTTYVLTDLQTVTTTFSSYFGESTQNNVVPTTAASNCQYALGEIPCGGTCCSSGQYCMTDINQCAAAGGGGSSGYYSSFYTASAPVRPTSNTVLTVTSTGAPTATVPFSAPVGTDGTTIIGPEPQTQGGGLSGGAIAGIVIGVLLAIILLILFCVCCCAKGAIDGILGIFGGGRKKRTETTYVEERYSHHGGSRPPPRRTWWGGRPARVDRTEKKSSGLGGFAKVGGALALLGVGLGLKRQRDRRHDDKSNSHYDDYNDRYTETSDSSLSSDRRSRHTRRSRG